MAINDRAANDGQDRAAKPRSRFFTVRLWAEEVAGGWEYCGTVQDVVGRAFRGFRDWSDLTDFMIARLDDDERTPPGCAKGGTQWPSEEQR
jgi:hypothetical protein